MLLTTATGVGRWADVGPNDLGEIVGFEDDNLEFDMPTTVEIPSCPTFGCRSCTDSKGKTASETTTTFLETTPPMSSTPTPPVSPRCGRWADFDIDDKIVDFDTLATTSLSLASVSDSSHEPRSFDAPGGVKSVETLEPDGVDSKRGAEMGAGLNGLQTVMLKNLPATYFEKNLVLELDSSGFQGLFDYVYVPRDVRVRINRGMAFINFVTGAAAESFYQKYHGQYFTRNSGDDAVEEALCVTPADAQGLEESLRRFEAAQRSRAPNVRPWVRRSAPQSATGLGGEQRRGSSKSDGAWAAPPGRDFHGDFAVPGPVVVPPKNDFHRYVRRPSQRSHTSYAAAQEERRMDHGRAAASPPCPGGPQWGGSCCPSCRRALWPKSLICPQCGFCL